MKVSRFAVLSVYAMGYTVLPVLLCIRSVGPSNVGIMIVISALGFLGGMYFGGKLTEASLKNKEVSAPQPPAGAIGPGN